MALLGRSKAPAPPPAPDALSLLSKEMQQLFKVLPGQIQTAVKTAIAESMSEGREAPPVEQNLRDTVAKQPTDEDIEKMSRVEYTKYLRGLMKEEIAPLDKEINSTRGEVTRADVQKRWDAMRGDGKNYPHLDKLGPVMQALAKEHPDYLMRIEDLYHVAAGKSREKIVEWEREAKEAEAATAAREPTRTSRYNPEKVVQFGGMTPVAKPIASGEETRSLEPNEAFDRAWDQIVGPGQESITAA